MEQKTKNILNILEAVMLVLVIIILSFFIYSTQTSGAKCMANPLVFGANSLSEQNAPAKFSCMCSFSNAPDKPIQVNSSGWSWFNPSFNGYYGTTNFSMKV